MEMEKGKVVFIAVVLAVVVVAASSISYLVGHAKGMAKGEEIGRDQLINELISTDEADISLQTSGEQERRTAVEQARYRSVTGQWLAVLENGGGQFRVIEFSPVGKSLKIVKAGNSLGDMSPVNPLPSPN